MFCPSGTPPHHLVLKVGTIVILLRNLNVSLGLCNGTPLIVTELQLHSIVAKNIQTGRLVIIPKIVFTPSDKTLSFHLRRVQFPVIPAFAMTINKSQGQSFMHVGIDLTYQVFSRGQLYVALSRSKDKNNIKIKMPEEKCKKVNCV
ncbi:hypothetical protein EIN_143770 [Entamoeba invadens IP1]|uniref:Uncharacterized protein n=1 Tax=Entamoeba invadens IP1 TaxID=370355 RepID=A0A0A1U9F3_ENTIV|nr:hypothetical protein EIN_143770 [Entamoeba invadens IP1]ELP91477.1 hypothetical protein EIN_143770 [Entamoeba invadens IP1]|eukprot:XP_004258248.1 hypothetical protein EIN_143770 [Entamoeba invadens IP1]